MTLRLLALHLSSYSDSSTLIMLWNLWHTGSGTASGTGSQVLVLLVVYLIRLPKRCDLAACQQPLTPVTPPAP